MSDPFSKFRPRAAEDVIGRIDGAEYCADCGEPFHPDELTEVRGEKFCAKCLPANKPDHLRTALRTLLKSMEQHPLCNPEIVAQNMRGDHTLECEIGGDEANISCWVAIARKALEQDQR